MKKSRWSHFANSTLHHLAENEQTLPIRKTFSSCDVAPEVIVEDGNLQTLLFYLTFSSCDVTREVIVEDANLQTFGFYLTAKRNV